MSLSHASPSHHAASADAGDSTSSARPSRADAEALADSIGAALNNCDREQIQYAAAVQPHGVLLVLREPALTIVQASANTALLGARVGAGDSLAQALGTQVETQLREQLQRLSPGPAAPLLLARLPALGARPALDVHAHRSDGLLLLEFERGDLVAPGWPGEALHADLNAALSALEQAQGVRQLLGIAVDRVRALTGFDRVMAYRFADDGSGEVVAEARDPALPSLLGLHYPALDIPLPARRLFGLLWLRHLPDVDYQPVPIEPPAIPGTDGQPNDLSHALLRSVSLMYRQYLRNMGVRATLVTTLMKNGRLWGLVSCHHHAGPRHLPQPTRAGCELLAHTLSMLLAAKEDREQAEYRHALAAMREALTRSLSPRCPLAPTLCHGTPSLLDAIDADGAAASFGTDLHCTGRTPPREMLPALVQWLAAQPDSEVFATDRLGECYPPMAAQADTAAGLLALRLTREQPGFILWFRPEQAKTVSWAGDPRKPAEIELDADGQERLTPRRSFELWRDEVRGRSRPWLDCEREHARLLRASLVDVVLAQADEILRVNRELARSNVELEAFAYAASHDLKEPLRGIHNAAELLSRSAQIRLNDEEHARLATVSRLARRMDELIDSLLHYSRVGRVDLELADTDLGAVLAHALDALADRIAERNVQLTLRPLPRLRCDRVRVEEVLRNLLANAIKYTDRAAPRIEVGSVKLADIGGTAIYVRDDGIGIAPRHHEQIFQIFRRLHGRDEYGGGAGAGLTIARRSVERHGGRLWVESEPGAGATFFFTLGPPAGAADFDALPPSADHAG